MNIWNIWASRTFTYLDSSKYFGNRSEKRHRAEQKLQIHSLGSNTESTKRIFYIRQSGHSWCYSVTAITKIICNTSVSGICIKLYASGSSTHGRFFWVAVNAMFDVCESACRHPKMQRIHLYAREIGDSIVICICVELFGLHCINAI